MNRINRLPGNLQKLIWIMRPLVFSAMAAILVLHFGAVNAPPADAQSAGVNAAKASPVQQAILSRSAMRAKKLAVPPDQTKRFMKSDAEAIQQIKTLNANSPSDKKHEIMALKRVIDYRLATLHEFLSPDQIKQVTESQNVDVASLMTEAIAVALDLTDVQMTSIDKVNLTYVENMLGAMREGDKNKRPRREQDAVSGRDSGMKKVLTPDQWTKYKNPHPQPK